MLEALLLFYSVQYPKGWAKLANIVAEANVSQFSRGNKFCCSETKKKFLPEVKNIFVSRTQLLRPTQMFPSLATQGNITSNNGSATVFPSLARPLVFLGFEQGPISLIKTVSLSLLFVTR